MSKADEVLSNLIDSLDSGLLTGEVPIEEVEAELRAAGCDPAELVARCRPKIEALLAVRREAWRERARARLAERGKSGAACGDHGCQREAGHDGRHDGLHMSRTWNAQLGDEVVEEWTDEPRSFVIAPDERATIQAVRRDIEARIQESAEEGGEDFAASLLADWRKQCDVLRRIAPHDHERKPLPDRRKTP